MKLEHVGLPKNDPQARCPASLTKTLQLTLQSSLRVIHLDQSLLHGWCVDVVLNENFNAPTGT